MHRFGLAILKLTQFTTKSGAEHLHSKVRSAH